MVAGGGKHEGGRPLPYCLPHQPQQGCNLVLSSVVTTTSYGISTCPVINTTSSIPALQVHTGCRQHRMASLVL